MSRLDRTLAKNNPPFISQPDDHLLICRCEEITKGQIRAAIHAGMHTMNELRKYLRTGMGLCQGQTCHRLVRGILARELGISPGDIALPTSRPPNRPIPMAVYASDSISSSKGGEAK